MDSKNQIQKREIKFRARHIKNKFWLQDFQISDCGNYIYECGETYNRDEVELLQYTGLKDKNGKEIFEGDILADNTSYYYTLIGWDLSGFKSKSVLKGGLNLNHSMPTFEFKNIIDYDDFARMKIVGNIYENPELLEAKND